MKLLANKDRWWFAWRPVWAVEDGKEDGALVWLEWVWRHPILRPPYYQYFRQDEGELSCDDAGSGNGLPGTTAPTGGSK